MTEQQFERLLQAIERNTAAVEKMSSTHVALAHEVGTLSDECVNLAALLVDPDGEAAADAAPAVDMAGRPIKNT